MNRASLVKERLARRLQNRRDEEDAARKQQLTRVLELICPYCQESRDEDQLSLPCPCRFWIASDLIEAVGARRFAHHATPVDETAAAIFMALSVATHDICEQVMGGFRLMQGPLFALDALCALRALCMPTSSSSETTGNHLEVMLCDKGPAVQTVLADHSWFEFLNMTPPAYRAAFGDPVEPYEKQGFRFHVNKWRLSNQQPGTLGDYTFLLNEEYVYVPRQRTDIQLYMSTIGIRCPWLETGPEGEHRVFCCIRLLSIFRHNDSELPVFHCQPILFYAIPFWIGPLLRNWCQQLAPVPGPDLFIPDEAYRAEAHPFDVQEVTVQQLYRHLTALITGLQENMQDTPCTPKLWLDTLGQVVKQDAERKQRTLDSNSK